MWHLRAALTAVAVLAGVASASANDALKIGVTPSIATAVAYVGKSEGIFSKHGLDVELINGNGAVLIAGVVSQSMDVSLPTVTTFLQAIDSGLPLSTIAGGSINEATESRIELRRGLDLKGPGDFAGKTVGVSSIGATLHVLFQQWLITGGVDPSKVNFVEIPFPQMADVVRQGSVDAVVTTEPFGSRITSSGAGILGPDFAKVAPDDLPILLFVSSNDWIARHGDVVKRFKAAVAETVALIESDPKAAKAVSNAYLKMPDPVIASMAVPKFAVAVDPSKVDLWIKMMVPMGLLTHAPSADDFVK